jgi:hypothetical protein
MTWDIGAFEYGDPPATPSYESVDASVAEARPVMGIDFYDDFGTHWRYNSGVVPLVIEDLTFEPDVCRVSELEVTNNLFRNTYTIELSRGNDFAAPYRAAPYESKIMVNVYRSLGEFWTFFWSGMVETVKFDDNKIPRVMCVPRTSSVARCGQRRICMVLCDLPLYSQGHGECKVNSASYKITGVIDSIDGVTFESTSFLDEAEGWLTGGELVIGNARRLIRAHTDEGATGRVVVSRPIINPETDTSGDILFEAFAGCDHTYSTCISKFNNIKNYGGQRFLPTKNPFMGEPVIY